MPMKFSKYMALILDGRWNAVSQEKQSLYMNERKEVWFRRSKYLSHTYQNFQTCRLSFFPVFKGLLTLDSLAAEIFFMTFT